MAEQPSTEQPTGSAVEPDGGGLGQLAVLEVHGNEQTPAKVEITPKGRRVFRPANFPSQGPEEVNSADEADSPGTDVAPLTQTTPGGRRVFRPASFQPSAKTSSEQTSGPALVEKTPGGRRIFRAPSAPQNVRTPDKPVTETADAREPSPPKRRFIGPPGFRQIAAKTPSGEADVISMPSREEADKTEVNHHNEDADDDTQQAVGRIILLPRDRGPTQETELDNTQADLDITEEIIPTNPNEVRLPGGHRVTVANAEPGAESYVTSWTRPDGQAVGQRPRRVDIREDREPADPTLVSGNHDVTEILLTPGDEDATGRILAPPTNAPKSEHVEFNERYDEAIPYPRDEYGRILSPKNVPWQYRIQNGWLRATAKDAVRELGSKGHGLFNRAMGAVGLDKVVERAYGPSEPEVPPVAEQPADDNTADSPLARAELEETMFYRKLKEQITDDDIPAAIQSAQQLLDKNGRNPGTIRFVANAFLNKRKGYHPSPEALKYVTSLASGDIDADPEVALQIRAELLETLDHFREADATAEPAPEVAADESEDAELLAAAG